jgi:hypothetical protein
VPVAGSLGSGLVSALGAGVSATGGALAAGGHGALPQPSASSVAIVRRIR